ncbi:hypothetical protein [Vibrio cholerae]|uniref:hypothetical protein n=3 Tax=Vibrio cholerae TaxID=666 RepID=UPI001CA34159|nr:hypothetical protein [Vibrio cholerae]
MFSIFSKQRSHIINVLYSFSLGFFSIRLNFIFGLLLFMDVLYSARILKPSFKMLGAVALLLIFIISFYLIGWDNIGDESIVERFSFLLFTVFTLSILSLRVRQREKLRIIKAFIYGMFCYSLPIVLISLTKGGYGYGSLYNPWTQMEMNSPSVSNDLALIASYMILFGSSKQRILHLFLLSLVIISGVYVGGRTFIFVVVVCLFLSCYTNLRAKQLVLVFPMIITSVIFVFITGLDKVLFSRFYEMGLESARFDLIIQALIYIPSYPYGGFEPSVYSYDGEWFHNFYLDTASTSGWYPLSVSIFFTAFIAKVVFRHYKVSFLFFFLTIVLIMSQDVIMEGNLKPFLLFIFSAVLLTQIRQPSKINQ